MSLKMKIHQALMVEAAVSNHRPLLVHLLLISTLLLLLLASFFTLAHVLPTAVGLKQDAFRSPHLPHELTSNVSMLNTAKKRCAHGK